MDRRVILAAAVAGAALPLAVSSQPLRPKRAALILYPFFGQTREQWVELFAREGFTDGRNLEILAIQESPPMSVAQSLSSAQRAVAWGADVIISPGIDPELTLLPASGNASVVVFGPDDGSGTVEAANRRGHNVTGVLYSYLQLLEKRFELLKALRPAARRATVLNRSEGPLDPALAHLRKRNHERIVDSVQKLGMEYVPLELPSNSPPEAVVSTLRKARIGVAEILCCWGAPLYERLAAEGFAVSTVGARAAKEGALIGGWSTGWVPLVAKLAAKVLRGTPASAIPVEYPREFGLAINLRTARTLGITVPASILVQSHEVYE